MNISGTTSQGSAVPRLAGGNAMPHAPAQTNRPIPPVDAAVVVNDNPGSGQESVRLRPSHAASAETAAAIDNGRLPQPAFATQMIDHWSRDDDKGLYLVRDRAYADAGSRMPRSTETS